MGFPGSVKVRHHRDEDAMLPRRESFRPWKEDVVCPP